MHQPIGTPPVCVEVIITAANEEWLAYLAHTLINDRIVARGHTTAPVRAIYRREDEICEEMQSRIGLHTRASLVSEIVERVDRDHPDDVQCIVATQIIDGNPDYLHWIVDETAGALDHHATTNDRRAKRGPGHWARGAAR